MKVLYTEEQIKEMVERLAREIVRDYGEEEIVLVILLRGACWFGVDLSRAIERLRTARNLYVEFMRVESYGDRRESSGEVKIEMDIQRSITNRPVIVVDDVAETCQTLAKVDGHLLAKAPVSLKNCVAVEKICPNRLVQVKLNYVGFRGVRGFLAGYGLDDKGTSRGLECIASLDAD